MHSSTFENGKHLLVINYASDRYERSGANIYTEVIITFDMKLPILHHAIRVEFLYSQLKTKTKTIAFT